MLRKAQKIRFGIFVVIALAGFIALLILITTQRFLRQSDIYYVAYENVSVSGLEIGSPVKYLGLKVGTIENIRIDPKHVNRIIVKIALNKGTPVKQDAKARIANIGITGLKMIEISGGTNRAPLLEPGNFIKPGLSVTEEITGKAEVIASKLETILNNLSSFTRPENLAQFDKMTQNVSQTFENLNDVIIENRMNLQQTLNRGKDVAFKLDSMSANLNRTSEDIRRIIGSDTLKEILSNAQAISGQLKQADLVMVIKELGELIRRTNQTLARIDNNVIQGSASVKYSLRKLEETLDNLKQASQAIADNPSVLIRGAKYKTTPDDNLEK